MIQFFRNLFRRRTTAPKPFRLPYRVEFDVERWRSNPNLVKEAADILHHPVMRDMIGALYGSIPSGFPNVGQDVSPTQAAVELGRGEGYKLCLLALLSLGQHPPVHEPVEADFGEANVLKDYDITSQ